VNVINIYSPENEMELAFIKSIYVEDADDEASKDSALIWNWSKRKNPRQNMHGGFYYK
jgi:hypothetical protein